MWKLKSSCVSIPKELNNQPEKSFYLNREIVLSRMIDDLPQTPWADIQIMEWETGDNYLPLKYSFNVTSFGEVLVANTPKGICYVGITERKKENVFTDFTSRFKNKETSEELTSLQQQVINFLNGEMNTSLLLHMKGTTYQIEIWRKLVHIPYGKVISYTTLAGNTRYARTAGTANGRNPVFWIVPCHRVVKSTGDFDRYFWGENIKKQLLAWEFQNSSLIL